jgi:hypothetical protein
MENIKEYAGEDINEETRMAIPATYLPMFKTKIAIQKKVHQNLLFKTWGGLGDQICSEPTLRYALRHFTDCKISLAAEKPELFNHLKFHKVFDLNNELPFYSKYLTFETITPPDNSNLVWQFFSHMLVNCVDFPSLCALRCQLPIFDRQIKLSPKIDARMRRLVKRPYLLVHPGRHWPTKTFPKWWWDEILTLLIEEKIKPIIIGADTDDNRGTVDINPKGCLDLRGRTSIEESIFLCQWAKVLLTNDSSPLHMAASMDPLHPDHTGNAWIGYVATCKHPDMITHWRKGIWQWREHNFGKGGIWDVISHNPNAKQNVDADKIDEKILLTWLPEPQEVVDWAQKKYFL